MDEDQLRSGIEEKCVQITTQGGAVRELKDRVKAKKKAKVWRSYCTVVGDTLAKYQPSYTTLHYFRCLRIKLCA